MEDVAFIRSGKSNLEPISYHSIRLDPVPQGMFWIAAQVLDLIGSGMPGKGIRLQERLGVF